MALFEQKKPLLIDFDLGITGTFVDFEDHTTEKNFVFPIFTPLNSFKKIKYAQAVPKSAISHVFPSKSYVGTESSWMIIFQGGDESIVKVIDRKLAERNKVLEDKLSTLEIQNAALQQQLKDANEGLQKAMRDKKTLVRGGQSPLGDQLGRTGPGLGDSGRSVFDDF